MSRAQQLFREHQAKFWKATSCDDWMATDCQLRAWIMFENAGGSTTANKQRYEEARFYLERASNV